MAWFLWLTDHEDLVRAVIFASSFVWLLYQRRDRVTPEGTLRNGG